MCFGQSGLNFFLFAIFKSIKRPLNNFFSLFYALLLDDRKDQNETSKYFLKARFTAWFIWTTVKNKIKSGVMWKYMHQNIVTRRCIQFIKMVLTLIPIYLKNTIFPNIIQQAINHLVPTMFISWELYFILLLQAS